ncbi:hypothetical protein D5H75_21125 [Bailinhaonella thermotolerans]|uniref:Uncharacterized protein n=2 Tax=Bailinhaonella thermotolerans TaxID=1070861 RepID=A0A3A4B9G4_9ACTN|nr:hypothetical protein D5H75_21125 [Bailinhaonella thermotolerans]
MPAALRGHREAKAGTHAPLVGRFLCPSSRLAEMRDLLVPEDLIELGLIADTGLPGLPAALSAIAAEPRVRMTGLEIALPREADQARAATVTLASLPADLGEDVDVFIELPRLPGWHEALERVAAAGRGAKLRTGGLSADLFPTPAEVAAFIEACVALGVPFKCTAGLHHAVRHRAAETGFVHHGFLNIVLATAAAVAGSGDAADILASEDADALAKAARAVPGETAARTRALFAGYGSCSLADPITDLRALGLID